MDGWNGGMMGWYGWMDGMVVLADIMGILWGYVWETNYKTQDIKI